MPHIASVFNHIIYKSSGQTLHFYQPFVLLKGYAHYRVQMKSVKIFLKLLEMPGNLKFLYFEENTLPSLHSEVSQTQL